MSFLLSDLEVALSKQCETSLNTNYSNIAEFQRVLVANKDLPIPEPEKVSDAGRVGNGHEYETPGRVCNTYWSQIPLTVEDDIDFDMSAKLFFQSFANAFTPSTVGSNIMKAFKMMPKADGTQLLSRTGIARLGGADFLHAGLVVQSYKMFQNGNDRPKYQAVLQNTGKFVTPSPAGVLAVPPYVCPSGNNVLIQWTDAGGVKNLTDTGCNVSAWSVEHGQSLKAQRCAGDPVIALPECPTAGASYVRSLTRKDDRKTIAQITYKLGQTLPEWAMMVCNTPITDFIIRVGASPAGLLATDVMQEARFPYARLSSVQITDDDGDAAQQITVVAQWDNTNATAINGRVISAEAAATWK